jgi:hypothetical protein
MQAFPVRKCPVEGKEGVLEVFISCTVCPFKNVLRFSTGKLESLRRLEAQLEAWGEAQERRYGERNEGNVRATNKVRAMIKIEEAELDA